MQRSTGCASWNITLEAFGKSLNVYSCSVGERDGENESGKLVHHPGLARTGALDNRGMVGILAVALRRVDIVEDNFMEVSHIWCLPGVRDFYCDD